MSRYIDCISEQVKKILSDTELERFQKEFDTLLEKYTKTTGDSAAADLVARDILNKKIDILQKQKLNKYAHIRKSKEFVTKAMEFKNPVNYVQDLYQKAANLGGSLSNRYLKYMDEAAGEFSAKNLETKRSTEHIQDVVMELMGEESGNEFAKALRKGIRKAFDISHKEYGLAGGIIGKIDNYVPQFHNRNAVGAVSPGKWADDIIELLDIDRMTDLDTGMPFTKDKLRKMLPDIYEDIRTGGLHDLASRLEKGKVTMGGAKGLAAKNSSSRFFVFKDAESFFKYNDTYGVGKDGLWDSIARHISNMAHDTAVLQTLGPNPTGIARGLDSVMRVKEVSSMSRGWANGSFDVLMGRTRGGNEGRFSLALSNLQNIMRSAYLGAASISAITDTFYAAAAGKINGMSPTKVMGRYFQMLNPAKDKALANRTLSVLEDAIGATLTDTRMTGDAMGGRVTRWLAGATNRLSGLHAMTKAAANAIQLEMQANLAEMSARAFNDLDPDFQRLLKHHDITEEMWGVIQKSKAFEMPNGNKFLNGEDILKSFDKQSKLILDTANAVDQIQVNLSQLATNEQTLRTAALTTGAAFSNNARKGDPIRMLTSNLLMFKSFPLTVMFTHLIPSLQRAGIPEALRHFKNKSMSQGMEAMKKGKWDHLALTSIGTTVMGGAAIQLKQIIAGKTPKEQDHKFWTAAMLQGGGLGIFGDVLFGDYSRFGRDPIIDMFVGPSAGLASDTYRAFKGNFDRMVDGKDVNMKRDLFKIAKRNTPLINLWYSRLMVERLLTDNIEKALDPNYHKRRRKYEKKLKKDFKQNYWWRRGESSPQ